MTQFLERLASQWQLRYLTVALCCGMAFYAVVMPAPRDESSIVSAASIDSDQTQTRSGRVNSPKQIFGSRSPESSIRASLITHPTPQNSGVWFQENPEAAALARRYAELFEKREPPKDATDLIRALRQRASRNDSVAQSLLIHAYQQGLGVRKNMTGDVRLNSAASDQRFGASLGPPTTPADLSQAFAAFQQAAEAGDPIAQLYLGLADDRDEDLSQDNVLAVDWFRKAARRGSISAACNLGEMLLFGEGYPKDSLEAGQWLNFAAMRGSPNAAYLLGIMYRHGDGVSQNEVTAAKWLLRAAEQGNSAAQIQLSEMYATGTGVEGDTARSYMWLNLASVTDSELREFRSEYEGLIPAPDRLQGQKLTHEWLLKHLRDRNSTANE